MSDELFRMVSGQGRCGSSAVMRAFILEDFPVFQTGGPPLYELIRNDPNNPITADRLLKEGRGKVCKILGPNGLLALPWHNKLRVLWLWRDFDEQARSAKEYRMEVLGEDLPYEKYKEATIQKEEAAQHILEKSCKASGAKYLNLRFEFLISEPVLAFGRILDLFEIDTLDPAKLAKHIKKRSPKVSGDGLRIEREVYKAATGKELDVTDINDGHRERIKQ